MRSDLPNLQDPDKDLIDQQILTLRRETLLPNPKSNIFKVKTMSKTKTMGQKKAALVGRFAFNEAIEETLLVDSVTKDMLI